MLEGITEGAVSCVITFVVKSSPSEKLSLDQR